MNKDFVDYLIKLIKKFYIKRFVSSLKNSLIICLSCVVIFVIIGVKSIDSSSVALIFGIVIFVILVICVGFTTLPSIIKKSKKIKAINKYFADKQRNIVWIFFIKKSVHSSDYTSKENFINLNFVDDKKNILSCDFTEVPEELVIKIKKNFPKADFGYSIEKEDKYLFGK